MIAVTLTYSMIDNFAPANLTIFNVYLFMLGLIVVPKLLFVLSSIVGRLMRRLLKLKRNWGNYFGLLLVLAELYVLFTGSMVGNDRLAVRHVTLEFDDSCYDNGVLSSSYYAPFVEQQVPSNRILEIAREPLIVEPLFHSQFGHIERIVVVAEYRVDAVVGMKMNQRGSMARQFLRTHVLQVASEHNYVGML